MPSPTYNIYIFTALECEAKPLINFFNLKKINSKPFSIYYSQQIILTVTGVGKTAMAGGVAYTLASFICDHFPILINIGIAGHKTEKLGELFLAKKIIDIDSGKTFYPQLLGSDWPHTCSINSHSLPSTLYSDDCLNDMEASAFYETATKFSSGELIHCIKIISDNQQSSITNINALNVRALIESQISTINFQINQLIKLQLIIEPIKLSNYFEIIKHWHFTATGKTKLKALLMQWNILSSREWDLGDTSYFNTGKALLNKLETDIIQLEVHL